MLLLACGVVGVSPAAAMADGALTILAEDANVRTAGGRLQPGEASEGGWNLWNNGELGEYVKFLAGGSHTITVRAGGTPAKGAWPSMAIRLDGRQIGEALSVEKKGFDDYVFKVEVAAGTHRVTVAFLNDAAVPDPGKPGIWLEDRNLFVNRIAIQSGAGGKTPVLANFEDFPREYAMQEAKILQDADKQIEQVRKADATIRVVDAQGKPVPDATVAAKLVRHEFLFGCNIYMFDRFKTAEENDLYKKRFADLFNYATVGFYWRGYEPVRGRPNYAYTDKVVAWCGERGIRMKGHPLLWGLEYGIPPWSKGQPDANTQRERVTEILRRYGGKITLWEVVNEPSHIAEPKIDPPYRWARTADANAYLIVNDYQVLADGCPPFLALLKRAQADGVPFDGIGIQAHEPRTMRFALDQVKDILDRYAQLHKDLHITEFTPASSGDPITGSLITGTWNEKAQEDYAVKFYRVCFAHPAVKGITWWDLCDQGSWLAGGGMLRKDLSPKPVYNSLMTLLHKTWRTQTQGVTDEAGRFRFRGFLGQYDVTATAGGKTVRANYPLTRQTKTGEAPAWVVTVP